MLDRIAQSRLVALALGYGLTALLGSVLVALQSGPTPAFVALFVNLLLAIGPVGCVWAGGHFVQRAGVRGWLAWRLLGDLVGLVAVFTLAYFALTALEYLEPGPRAGWIGWESVIDPKLGAAVVLTLVNVIPLGASLGLEVAARGRDRQSSGQ